MLIFVGFISIPENKTLKPNNFIRNESHSLIPIPTNQITEQVPACLLCAAYFDPQYADMQSLLAAYLLSNKQLSRKKKSNPKQPLRK